MYKYADQLWTDYQEVCEYAKSRAMALETVVLIRAVPDGWIVPYHYALSNRWPPAFNDRDTDDDPIDSVCSDDDEDVGDGSSGLQSTCGETVMEGYLLFHGD